MSDDRKDCKVCNGTGVCGACEGEGMTDCTCPDCNTWHECDCIDCDGSGDCYECLGEGVLFDPTSDDETQTELDMEEDG